MSDRPSIESMRTAPIDDALAEALIIASKAEGDEVDAYVDFIKAPRTDPAAAQRYNLAQFNHNQAVEYLEDLISQLDGNHPIRIAFDAGRHAEETENR